MIVVGKSGGGVERGVRVLEESLEKGGGGVYSFAEVWFGGFVGEFFVSLCV